MKLLNCLLAALSLLSAEAGVASRFSDRNGALEKFRIVTASRRNVEIAAAAAGAATDFRTGEAVDLWQADGGTFVAKVLDVTATSQGAILFFDRDLPALMIGSTPVCHDPVSVRCVGPWRIAVAFGGREAEFDVESAEVVTVTDEPASPFVPAPDADPFARPILPKGYLADNLTAPDAYVPGSMRVKSRNGEVYRPAVDFLVSERWGSVAATTNRAYGKDVLISYRYARARIDSVTVDGTGRLALVKGTGDPVMPRPPALADGVRRLANVIVRGRTEALSDENLLPIRPKADRVTASVAEPVAKRLLPKTWRKLSEGGTLRLMAWGDSVTAGAFVPEASRLHRLYERELRRCFPQAKVEATSNGWGGHRVDHFLNAPKGHRFNFAESVIGRKPDLVCMEFVNDAELSEEAACRYYRTVAEAFRAAGVEWVATTPHYTIPGWFMGEEKSVKGLQDDPRACVRALRRVTSEYGVPLMETSRRWGELEYEGIPYDTLYVNAINHPCAEAMALYAEEFGKLFR